MSITATTPTTTTELATLVTTKKTRSNNTVEEQLYELDVEDADYLEPSSKPDGGMEGT